MWKHLLVVVKCIFCCSFLKSNDMFSSKSVLPWFRWSVPTRSYRVFQPHSTTCITDLNLFVIPHCTFPASSLWRPLLVPRRALVNANYISGHRESACCTKNKEYWWDRRRKYECEDTLTKYLLLMGLSNSCKSERHWVHPKWIWPPNMYRKKKSTCQVCNIVTERPYRAAVHWNNSVV